jgi:hypothetical protein
VTRERLAEATRVHPLAIRAVDEIRVDLRGPRSKTLERFVGEPWDDVVTGERLAVFRRVRDQIGARLRAWLADKAAA